MRWTKCTSRLLWKLNEETWQSTEHSTWHLVNAQQMSIPPFSSDLWPSNLVFLLLLWSLLLVFLTVSASTYQNSVWSWIYSWSSLFFNGSVSHFILITKSMIFTLVVQFSYVHVEPRITHCLQESLPECSSHLLPKIKRIRELSALCLSPHAAIQSSPFATWEDPLSYSI